MLPLFVSAKRGHVEWLSYISHLQRQTDVAQLASKMVKKVLEGGQEKKLASDRYVNVCTCHRLHTVLIYTKLSCGEVEETVMELDGVFLGTSGRLQWCLS